MEQPRVSLADWISSCRGAAVFLALDALRSVMCVADRLRPSGASLSEAQPSDRPAERLSSDEGILRVHDIMSACGHGLELRLFATALSDSLLDGPAHRRQFTLARPEATLPPRRSRA